jgi:hypothetical protein
MHNKPLMPTLAYSNLGALFLIIALTSCTHKSGPDQTLIVPDANFTITDHEPGDLGFSKTLTGKDGSTLEVSSYVPAKVSVVAQTQLESYRAAMLAASQNVPILSRYWTIGEFKMSRQFVPLDVTDVDHGAVNVLAEAPNRVFTFLFRNPNLKQAEIITVAEKTAVDMVNIK